MSIKVHWDNSEKTICRWVFGPGWSWDDIIVADQITHDMYDTVNHNVHNIMDLSEAGHAPTGLLNRAPQIARMLQGHPNDASPVIIVGASGFTTHLITIFDRVYSGKIASVSTLDEAYAIVTQVRKQPL